MKLTAVALRKIIREEIERVAEVGMKGYDRWKTEPGPYGTGDEVDNEDMVLAAAAALMGDREFVDALLSMGAGSMRDLVGDAEMLIRDEGMDLIGDMGLDGHDDVRQVAGTLAHDLNMKMGLGLS